MKRFQSGAPRLSKLSRVGRDVARVMACAPKLHGVCSTAGLEAGVDVAGRDAAPVDDFVEFLLGERVEGRDPSVPDPIFRDRLRRRLWRLHALTLLRDGRAPH